MATTRNIVLFIGQINKEGILAVRDLEKHLKRKFRIAVLTSKAAHLSDDTEYAVDLRIRVDLKSYAQLDRAILPIKDQVAVVNCRAVFYMPVYANIIGMFPHLVMPTRDSIEWTSNKLDMRRKFRRYFPEITPKFVQVYGAKSEDLQKVKKNVGFPCIVKPASLAASRFVAVCYHQEELASTLRKTFRAVRSAYKKQESILEPEVIVEQFMEGTMYSMDGYVDNEGKLKCLPLVHVKTGQDIGVDDFFNYRVLTPTALSKETQRGAEVAAQKAVTSLSLRNVMVHAEFIRIDDDWKVLEIDARMGGHRDMMHRLSDGTPHGMNDLLIRLGEKPVIKRKVKNYVASFNFFPKKKGKLKSVKGLKKVRELKSLCELLVKKKVGEQVGLSKQGYAKVLDITLANPSREALLADIRRMEQAIKIEV